MPSRSRCGRGPRWCAASLLQQKFRSSQPTRHDTTRHLCLTDLARAGWELHAIATFAGHRTTDSTLRYIHLSGRELADKFARGMAGIHDWRISLLTEADHEGNGEV